MALTLQQIHEYETKVKFENAVSTAVFISLREMERIFLQKLRAHRDHSKDPKFIESINYIALKLYGEEDYEKYMVNNHNLEIDL